MSIKICCVCENKDAKYKCPKCKQTYCSVVCCNKHRDNCKENTEVKVCSESKSPVKKSDMSYDFPTEDTVPIDKLEQLRYSEEVTNCLKNPQVRDIISSVLRDKDPTKAIAKAMIEPVFVELADACLKIVEPPDEEKPC
ncbi:hypothetical protein TSAR_017002 [Trichomalopsis sarcophagae]|uniref:HIT-type domain-containing protein n=1 Tax=Trichomalopsis sarcophagae TaxID=543379 RepID=A0A232FM00_9HYME|nr:hypothetical protein TSAR_017002 [Trichomalopsis sarcophagae]